VFRCSERRRVNDRIASAFVRYTCSFDTSCSETNDAMFTFVNCVEAGKSDSKLCQRSTQQAAWSTFSSSDKNKLSHIVQNFLFLVAF
jgi:hypothetical protein